MEKTKMTNRKALSFVLSTYAETLPTDVADKLNAMVVALDKKSSAERKPTTKQTENASVRVALVDYINENMKGDGFTCSELLKVCPIVEGKSNQYVSAILRQAVLAGELSRGSVKRHTYFAPVGFYANEEKGE